MKLGWIRDLVDHRDMLFAAPPQAAPFPPAFKMSAAFVYDQGSLGSCTANAVSAVFEMTQLETMPEKAVMPSRLALYYWTRVDQGTKNSDSGASIRGTMKAAMKHGVCREVTWPYNVKKFKLLPSTAARGEEAKHRLDGAQYARVAQTEMAVKATLMAGNPIAFGFSVYESFMSGEVAKTGVMPMPRPSERLMGGHAVVLIGWDDAKQAFLVKNSWGSHWGDAGNFWMPYDFLLSTQASDLWTIFKVPAL